MICSTCGAPVADAPLREGGKLRGPCCNPDHLFLGTHQHNMADMMTKGRRGNDAAGEKNGNAKLTASAVSAIRRSAANGMGLEELAAAFGTTPMNVRSILKRRTWRHVA